MVTELPDKIEFRHTITRSFVSYKFVACLLTHSLILICMNIYAIPKRWCFLMY